MLTKQYGIAAGKVEILPNAVDLTRFSPRSEPLPRTPQTLLLCAKTHGVLRYFIAANETLGLRLQAFGIGVGRPTKTPERFLSRADIVVATGRMAIEAICAGAAVVVADQRGVAGMVSMRNYEALHSVNFGATALTGKLTAASLRTEIRKYNARETARVVKRMREDASLEKAVDRLERLYREAISANTSKDWTADDSAAVRQTLDAWPAEGASSSVWRDVREQLASFLATNERASSAPR